MIQPAGRHGIGRRWDLPPSSTARVSRIEAVTLIRKTRSQRSSSASWIGAKPTYCCAISRAPPAALPARPRSAAGRELRQCPNPLQRNCPARTHCVPEMPGSSSSASLIMRSSSSTAREGQCPSPVHCPDFVCCREELAEQSGRLKQGDQRRGPGIGRLGIRLRGRASPDQASRHRSPQYQRRSVASRIALPTATAECGLDLFQERRFRTVVLLRIPHGPEQAQVLFADMFHDAQ